MHYDYIAIPDADVPQAVDLTFQHVLQTYVSETNKTVSVWQAVPDNLLDFKPHEKTNPIRTILVHQLLPSAAFSLNLSAPRSRSSKNCYQSARSQSSRRTSRSTSAWRNGGCHSSRGAPPPGGWRVAPSSAGCGGAHLGFLAASAAHLPSPHAGSDLAAACRSARPRYLRAFGRREVGRGRPDLLSGGGKQRRKVASLIPFASSSCGQFSFSFRRILPPRLLWPAVHVPDSSKVSWQGCHWLSGGSVVARHGVVGRRWRFVANRRRHS